MKTLWLVRLRESRPGCRGVAEIRVEGSPFRYVRSTIVGRLYRAHLTEGELEALISAVASAVEALNKEEKHVAERH